MKAARVIHKLKYGMFLHIFEDDDECEKIMISHQQSAAMEQAVDLFRESCPPGKAGFVSIAWRDGTSYFTGHKWVGFNAENDNGLMVIVVKHVQDSPKHYDEAIDATSTILGRLADACGLHDYKMHSME